METLILATTFIFVYGGGESTCTGLFRQLGCTLTSSFLSTSTSSSPSFFFSLEEAGFSVKGEAAV